MAKQLFLALVLVTAAVAALAQLQEQGPPTHFEGNFVSYTDDSITLKQDDGVQVILPMSPGWFVARARQSDVSEIREGTFIASRNLPVEEGVGRSQELRFYGEKYRPEFGTHMMRGADTAMTHGYVESIRPGDDGTRFHVTYPDGERTLIIPDDISVTAYDELSRDILEPGTRIDVVSRKDGDGILRAQRVTVE